MDNFDRSVRPMTQPPRLPRFLRSMSERPYKPDNEPQKVYVAYRDGGMSAVLRCWTVCEGTEPTLDADAPSFATMSALERFVDATYPELERVDRAETDMPRVIATWV